jgi:hypothetical protein
MSTIRTVALSATIASLASVPAVQIPIGFQTPDPVLVELDDTSGPYTVPTGKKLLMKDFMLRVGFNSGHPTYQGGDSLVNSVDNISELRVEADPSNALDVGQPIARTDAETFMTVPRERSQFISVPEGVTVQVYDNDGGELTPNRYGGRSVFVGQLVDA